MYYIQMMEPEWSEIDLIRIAPIIESIIPGTTKYRSKPLFFFIKPTYCLTNVVGILYTPKIDAMLHRH